LAGLAVSGIVFEIGSSASLNGAFVKAFAGDPKALGFEGAGKAFGKVTPLMGYGSKADKALTKALKNSGDKAAGTVSDKLNASYGSFC
jgi:hypothetical protein